MRRRQLRFLLPLLGLVACSRQDQETASAGGEPQHVWKEQVQTLDKARQVEDTLIDAHRRRAEEPE